MRWVAKRINPESILGTYDTEDEAREVAEQKNKDYQTDNYTWEPWDREKMRRGWGHLTDVARSFRLEGSEGERPSNQ